MATIKKEHSGASNTLVIVCFLNAVLFKLQRYALYFVFIIQWAVKKKLLKKGYQINQ